jgi:spore maturation protein CgeB
LRIVIFCHSLISDWNHGNAHFLRGITAEMIARGFEVMVYEPHNSWSLQNLLARHGEAPVKRFHAAYPQLQSIRYEVKTLDLDEALDRADMVLVHEWNDQDIIRRIGEHRARLGGYRLLFHDTHHRSVTDEKSMRQYDLSNYDGVLAFGRVIRDLYIEKGWTDKAWTWHEAADTRVFYPSENATLEGDLVWVGNWGDEERADELKEFLIDPVKDLKLKASVHGVRYPKEAKQMLREAGIEYKGWLPNYEAPRVFAQYKVTVHVPRRPYVAALPGIPTIRVFEALACGIPLVSAPWTDAENLFTPGKDFLVARDGDEMRAHLKALAEDREMRREIASHGLRTILRRHTCAHRVDELLGIYSELEETSSERAMTV